MGRIGVLMAVFGIGLAMSALWASRRERVSAGGALAGGLGGAALGLALFAISASPLPQGASALWTGLCLGPLLAAAETELQRAAGPRRRGRAFAGRDFVSRLAFLAAVPVAGWAVRQGGASASLLVGAAILFLLAAYLAVGWRSRKA